jgi:hypothetical protein
LSALKKGEILPGIDIELELEMTQQEKLDNMAFAMPVNEPIEAPEDDEEAQEANQSKDQGSNPQVLEDDEDD